VNLLQENPAGFIKDLELEEWDGRQTSTLVRRVLKIFGVESESPTEAGKNKTKPYTEAEEDIVDRGVTQFCKVFL
jgi:hypothetical protein